MTTLQETPLYKAIYEDEKMNAEFRAYLTDRGVFKFYSALLDEFTSFSEENKNSKSLLAKKICKDKAQITRLLSSAQNMTLGTYSLLMAAMGKELEYKPKDIFEHQIINDGHALNHFTPEVETYNSEEDENSASTDVIFPMREQELECV